MLPNQILVLKKQGQKGQNSSGKAVFSDLLLYTNQKIVLE
jgi:hypothetical protein